MFLFYTTYGIGYVVNKVLTLLLKCVLTISIANHALYSGIHYIVAYSV